MFYREIGQFKTNYGADQQIFPIRQDRWAVFALIAFALIGIPLLGDDYWLNAILTPVLSFALAALGLNLVTGYAGQLSLGGAAFMSVGAYTAFNLMVRTPIPFPICIVIGGFVAAIAGLLFGLPSLRIKGFYLVVSTLAAQFFFSWLFDSYKWFKNNNPQGELKPPPMLLYEGGDRSKFVFDGNNPKNLFDGATNLDNPVGRYVVTIVFVIIFTFLAKNLVRSIWGRREIWK
jgi:branched-chain amino acid transport system permease protein